MANVDMFLKLTGIDGESRDSAHAGEIDIQSWNWAMFNASALHSGGGGGAGKVQVQPVTLMKRADKSSPTLMKYCCKGSHIDEAVLTVRKQGGDPLEYYIIRMKHVLVTQVSVAPDDVGPGLSETVNLEFKSFEVDYQPQKEDGSKDGGAIKMTWNVEGNSES